MVFYTSPIPCVIIALIILMHIVSVLYFGRYALCFGIVNICLHIGLAASILVLGAQLSEAVMLYSVSFLIYLSLFYFKVKLEKRKKEDEK